MCAYIARTRAHEGTGVAGKVALSVWIRVAGEDAGVILQRKPKCYDYEQLARLFDQ